MRNIKQQPMYIAVQLMNTDTKRRAWLDLPATKAEFAGVIGKINAERGNFSIAAYERRVPGLPLDTLMDAPLSVVNHFASRLGKLTDADVLKLCAIGGSLYYLNYMRQFVDFTYKPDDYTLLKGVCDEEALGSYYLGKPDTAEKGAGFRQCALRYEYGKARAKMEQGAFTSLGYITSKNKWEPDYKTRPVPDKLNLRGYLGEELYGNWDYCEL